MIAIAAREISKNVLMSLPGLRRARSRWGRGRTTARLDLAAARDRVNRAVRAYDDALAATAMTRTLAGARVLEIGPGANLGVAATLLARGSVHITCVDRFPELRRRPVEHDLYQGLLGDATRAGRLLGAGPGTEPVRYVVQPVEAFRADRPFDVVMSYHVLQHVADLGPALRAMREALKPGGLMLHIVDLRTLGNVDRDGTDPLRLLAFSPTVWRWMGSARGLPSQARRREYLEACRVLGLEIIDAAAVEILPRPVVARARRLLHPAHGPVSDDELSVAQFRLIARTGGTR